MYIPFPRPHTVPTTKLLPPESVTRLRSRRRRAKPTNSGPPADIDRLFKVANIMARSKLIRKKSALALAQKERQGTEQVTKSQSLTVVKNLVRVSISTVCHLRNIFPHSCFQQRSYAGMRIYQLDASSRDACTNETVIHNEHAYMLTQWLEYGVFEAIERKYLRRMEFLVVSPELNRPRESYSFEMDYPDSEDDYNMRFSGTNVTTAESTKGQLVKLIRSLIQFSNTLDEVPSERMLNLKLWYYEDRTPPDWEPKHFQAADPSDLCFKREGDHDNLRIRIGELHTPHHTVKVRFEGFDSTLETDRDTGNGGLDNEDATVDNDDIEGDDQDTDTLGCDRTATRWSETGNLLMCKAGPEEEDEEEDEEDGQHEEPIPPAAGRDVSRLVSGRMTQLEVSAKNHTDSETVSDILESKMNAARIWIKTQAAPKTTDLMNHLNIDRAQARVFMQRMLGEGLITKDSKYRYHLVGPPRLGTAPEAGRSNSHKKSEDIDSEDGERSPSQTSSISDDSATQAPEVMTTQPNRRGAPSTMPPPQAPSRRGGDPKGTTPENTRRESTKGFATPIDFRTAAEPDLQPVPEKQQQARILSMGTKRVLDAAELSDDDNTRQDDLIDMFNPPTGMLDSTTTLGYEMSLSQASAASSRARKKCSLAAKPIRQSSRSKKLRSSMDGGFQSRGTEIRPHIP